MTDGNDFINMAVGYFREYTRVLLLAAKAKKRHEVELGSSEYELEDYRFMVLNRTLAPMLTAHGVPAEYTEELVNLLVEGKDQSEHISNGLLVRLAMSFVYQLIQAQFIRLAIRNRPLSGEDPLQNADLIRVFDEEMKNMVAAT